MKYSMTERLLTTVSQDDLLIRIETILKEICGEIERRDKVIEIRGIESKFLAFPLRELKDNTIITAKPIAGGFLLQADVKHRPKAMFWLWLFVPLFTPCFFISIWTLVFYILSVKAIRPIIERAFKRICNECSTPAPSSAPQANIVDHLERLAQLKEKGVLSSTEFEEQKAKLLV